MSATLRTSLVIVAALGVHVGDARAETRRAVRVDNAVAACLRITPGAVQGKSNLLLLPAEVTVTHSVAQCGCRAAALSYRVLDSRSRRMAVGDIWNVERDQARVPFEFTFVLSTDAAIKFVPPFRLTVGCAPAD